MIGLLDFVRLVVKALTPSDNPDPAAQLAWRKAVALSLIGVILVGIFSFLWAQGRIPGLSGVALAEDLSALRTQIASRQDNLEASQRSLLLLTVKAGLKQSLKDRCNALYAKNQPAIDAANADLDQFADQYRALTGHDYFIPDCSVILIEPGNK